MKNNKEIKKVCSKCGSDDVWCDGTAVWCEETQDWVLQTVYQYSYCHNCDGDTTLVDKEKQVIIEANNKCLAFKGTSNQAIDFVDMMREIGIATGADFENILSDFIFNIEVELQNYGYLDEDFNKTDK